MTAIRKIMLAFMIIAIPYVLLSCGGREKNYYSGVVFTDSISVRAVAYNTEIIMMPPSNIELVGSELLLFRPGGGYAAIGFDISKDSAARTIWHIGNGPNEFIAPFFAGQNHKDSTMFVYDSTKATLYNYKWHRNDNKNIYELIETKDNKNGYGSSTTILDNGYIVSQNLFVADNTLVLFDRDYNIVTTFCNPLKISQENFARLYQGHITSCGNEAVFAMTETGYITYLSVSDSGEVTTLWEHFLSEPIFLDGSRERFDDDKNRRGFYDVKIMGDYVYALYNGFTYDDGRSSTTILVFERQSGA
ncbi:MAG: TolB-like 6-bladed beta-propeller domain-containing protein, partial [Rikenellaceae bacterium]|nr:TolB-like 6-bladed beta-propeller domain-containing protein [Rikenellaceae bacterium]MCL2692813.1 TolB-like 6-bladed beta-propeller domain-containing protein [Rikenellaceae bacterium]